MTNRDEFDPSTLNTNDPLAMQIDWKPRGHFGLNYRYCGLVRISSNQLEFRATLQMKLYSLLHFSFLAVILILSYFAKSSDGSLFTMTIEEWKFFIFFVFLYLSIGLMSGSLDFKFRIVFDKNRGLFWKGFRSPKKEIAKKGKFCIARLDDIHAIQIVSNFFRDSESTSEFTSYELNLVQHNGERINIISHSKYEILLEESVELSRFLSVPIWNAVT